MGAAARKTPLPVSGCGGAASPIPSVGGKGHPNSGLILQSRAVCAVLGTAASLSPFQKPL